MSKYDFMSNQRHGHLSFTNEPTVLIVLDPKEDPYYEWKYSNDVIFKHTICLPYVSSDTKCNFESVVKDINPRVIILMDTANTVMSNVFTIDNHRVVINNKEYPVFRYDELEKYHDEIKQLALLPYRGTEHRVTYSEEEMEELVKQGIAIEIPCRR